VDVEAIRSFPLRPQHTRKANGNVFSGIFYGCLKMDSLSTIH
jgi:hypothetical protein